MRLQLQTDYALRTLLALASNPERLMTVPEIASTFEISQNHLVKVANQLVHLGWVEATRGRGGGMRLAVAPELVRIGAVVRGFEGDHHVLACVGATSSDCVVHSVCDLRGLLGRAEEAFFAELDTKTLADLAAPGAKLVRRIRRSRRDVGAAR